MSFLNSDSNENNEKPKKSSDDKTHNTTNKNDQDTNPRESELVQKDTYHSGAVSTASIRYYFHLSRVIVWLLYTHP